MAEREFLFKKIYLEEFEVLGLCMWTFRGSARLCSPRIAWGPSIIGVQDKLQGQKHPLVYRLTFQPDDLVSPHYLRVGITKVYLMNSV